MLDITNKITSWVTLFLCGRSSMVEPQPSKLMMWVRSPSPAPNAHIAQSVEHFLGKEEVTGSNPVMGSK